MKYLHILSLLPFVLSHPSGEQAPKPPYEIGTITIPLTDPRPDPFSPEPRSRALMVTVTYPLLAALKPAQLAKYPFAAYFPPQTARFSEIAFGLPEGFLADVKSKGRDHLPFISASKPPKNFPKIRVVGSTPGHGGLRLASQNLTGHLTQQHGYITLSTESPYEADVVEYPDGRLATNQFPNFEGEPEIVKKFVDARVKDWAYILKMLPTEAILGQIPGCGGSKKALKVCQGLVETEKIGVFGHSLGGHTVGALASLDLTWKRLSGVVNLDGTYTDIVTGEKSKGMRVPFFDMGRGDRVKEPAWETAKAKAKKLKIPNGEMLVNGTAHNSFTDLPGLAKQLGLDALLPKADLEAMLGTGDLGRQNLILREYLGAFFVWVFGREEKGKKQPLGLLKGNVKQYPEVIWKEKNWNY